jgi:16S rRNA U516 pseudouridylate synthase RsuA-like enzyme
MRERKAPLRLRSFLFFQPASQYHYHHHPLMPFYSATMYISIISECKERKGRKMCFAINDNCSALHRLRMYFMIPQ